MQYMITVQEARALIQQQCSRLAALQLPLAQAGGKVLAHTITAPLDIPAYPQSSMDGYAFLYQPGKKNYTLQGEMAAGSSHAIALAPAEAVRIFTGAPVPPGADTVLMQEKAAVQEDQLTVLDENLSAGTNVRPVGSEIAAGATALVAGALLTPAAIGFLAGLGIAEVPVVPMPKVSILVTGNELCTPGLPLAYGQVYEANSYTLIAALAHLGIQPQACYSAGDNPAQLTELLGQALAQSDAVLMTGGVSVGDYDFTTQAFEQCGVQKIFHKIKQKPGKPILFGRHGSKPVFGLPGNPASVLTCYYQYVLPALGMLSGRNLQLPVVQAELTGTFTKPAGLTHFLKAYYQHGKVTLLTGQESYKLNSFAVANGLAEIPADTTALAAGETVAVHLFN